MAEPYQAQVGTGSSSLSGASPEAFGAAVGRSLQYAGDVIEEIKRKERERDADEEATAATVQFARDGEEIDKAAIDARTVAEPGGKGHSEAVTKLIEERQAAALGAIKNPKIRNAMTERYANLRERVAGREYGWEAGERVRKLVDDIDTTGTIFANQQASAPDAASMVQSLDDVATSITLLTGIDEGTKAKAIKEQQRKIVGAWGNAMQLKDPATVRDALDKGLLNQYLEPEDINNLRAGALVEIRRQEAATRQKANEAEAAARERVQLLLKKTGDNYVPTEEEWAAAEQDVKTYKLEGPAWDLGVAKDRGLVNRETRDWTPGQWRANIAALEAKGDKRTAGENIRLKHLSAAAPKAIGRFNSDPHAAAAAAGSPAPDIDGSPASIERRVTWARSYAAASGLQLVPYLNNEELKGYRDRASTGTAGQLDVAATLRGTFGVSIATAISKQIDPDNQAMQLMIQLPPATALDYKVGDEAVKRNAKLFVGEIAAELHEDFAAAIPQQMRSAVFEAAKKIAAAELDRAGTAEPKDDEFAAAYRRALHRAVGASGNAGGFVRWGEAPIWIPPEMPKDEALRRLSRANAEQIIEAHSDVDGSGPGGAPYYMGADGRRVKMTPEQAGQLIRQGRLETVNPGIYRVVLEDGSHVGNKNGGYWQFNIRKLP